MKHIALNERLLFAIIMMLIFTVAACKDNSNNSKRAEEFKLESMMKDIIASSETVKCEDAADWKFTAIGSKACGGPTGFISYSIKIDTGVFLLEVRTYTDMQSEFNKKWSIISDCSGVVTPKSIECTNGKAKLTY